MTYPCKMAYSSTWEWTLHAWGDNGTEVQLRRYVASLENSATLSSQHVAPLPNALLLKTIEIQISEYGAHDRLYMWRKYVMLFLTNLLFVINANCILKGSIKNIMKKVTKALFSIDDLTCDLTWIYGNNMLIISNMKYKYLLKILIHEHIYLTYILTSNMTQSSTFANHNEKVLEN